MKLHIMTVGKPRLPYARAGFEEYTKRLHRFHELRITHVPDRHNDTAHIIAAAKEATLVALVIDAPQKSSEELSDFLKQQELRAKELCFIIGGPEGLPSEVIERADYKLSLSKLTFPHDLAMVVLAEALYRASSIGAGHPYHRS